MQECPVCHRFLKNHTVLAGHMTAAHPEKVPEQKIEKETEIPKEPEKIIEKIEKIVEVEKESEQIQEQEEEPEPEQKPQSSNAIWIIILVLAVIIGIFIFFGDKIKEILYPEEKKQ